MAHLKMDMLLSETGYITDSEQRFRIFLTNSLEEAHPDSGTLFSSWLSDEANQANQVKNETPVMVVMGNPPYSGESANKGEWIMNLMEDYKKEPGGKQKLNERNPKWINDDYVKFLRFGQYFIDQNSCGVLAFINPHGFLDNPTFRGMRWNLMQSFTKIYTIDLHGNVNKKEVSPDGSVDQNVFDIQQGVSINILIKNDKSDSKKLADIFNYDLYGKREFKYDFLNKNTLGSIPFIKIPNKEPMYYMVQKDFELESKYEEGFSLDKLFTYNSIGVVTARDSLVVDYGADSLKSRLISFFQNDTQFCKNVLKVKENSTFSIEKVKSQVSFKEEKIIPISYRPFDDRYIYFEQKLIDRSRGRLIDNYNNSNYSIVFRRQQPESNDLYIFISKNIIADGYIRSDNKGGESIAPLHVYHDDGSFSVNLDKEILEQIGANINLGFNEENHSNECFTSIEVLDYVYGALHHNSYRNKFAEFLKINYPRVPFPKNKEMFYRIVSLGKTLRLIHLFETDIVEEYITQYPEDGDNVVDNTKYVNVDREANPHSEYKVGNVFINKTQYFANVPEVAWNFYIGGYQPAQKWLKDRKGRELNFEDILHYQKIIVALVETDRTIKEIDKIDFM